MKQTNRLIHETSPYLLQHAHNPVDWYAWGEEAFRRARAEDKPLFLSIGYSACHWCHVMERESFENEEIASQLNRDFVSIKVDREERPDIDSIYMQAVQMMTGQGGWPMSMFLTPDAKPFYGGTYFPPDDRHGLPAFSRVLQHVATAYRQRRDDVAEATREVVRALEESSALPAGGRQLTAPELDRAAGRIAASYDSVHGGFGSAPKFPPSVTLDFLMQVEARGPDTYLHEVITHTLRAMACGGIYDQIGGGFHRYSVDAEWLVPHFEKMLYDNALLSRLYTRAFQRWRDPLFARVARETLGFVAREMTSPEGAFYSTLDADSEGEEGKFYLWSREEIEESLGAEEASIFCKLFDVTSGGNFEGNNILNIPREPEAVASESGIGAEKLAEIAARGKCHLYGVRDKRVHPARDEKVLAAWNGWMLTAFAEAALAFDSDAFREVTSRNAGFLTTMWQDGRLYRSWKAGAFRIAGVLEDYAGVAAGLIAAFEALQQMRWLELARELGVAIVERFSDTEGGFFDTPADGETLIARPRDLFDNATPSGNSMAIAVLQKLALYYGDSSFARAAQRALERSADLAVRHPSGFGFLLGDWEAAVSGIREIAITGADSPGGAVLLRAVCEAYLPHRILVWRDARLPILEGKPPDRAAVYICRNYVCEEPVTDPARLREML
jgi:uncharacterized protein